MPPGAPGSMWPGKAFLGMYLTQLRHSYNRGKYGDLTWSATVFGALLGAVIGCRSNKVAFQKHEDMMQGGKSSPLQLLHRGAWYFNGKIDVSTDFFTPLVAAARRLPPDEHIACIGRGGPAVGPRCVLNIGGGAVQNPGENWEDVLQRALRCQYGVERRADLPPIGSDSMGDDGAEAGKPLWRVALIAASDVIKSNATQADHAAAASATDESLGGVAYAVHGRPEELKDLLGELSLQGHKAIGEEQEDMRRYPWLSPTPGTRFKEEQDGKFVPYSRAMMPEPEGGTELLGAVMRRDALDLIGLCVNRHGTTGVQFRSTKFDGTPGGVDCLGTSEQVYSSFTPEQPMFDMSIGTLPRRGMTIHTPADGTAWGGYGHGQRGGPRGGLEGGEMNEPPKAMGLGGGGPFS